MLRVGAVLRGIYRIERYLSSGGFGNTYVAINIEFNERVAIKEFFISGINDRWKNSAAVSVSNGQNLELFEEQKEKFKKEARRIRRFNNPHIVRVHDLFEENGTAYYVMDYIDGESLSDRLQRTGKPLSEAEIRWILPQILDALQYVHNSKIWHLDVKPANILLDKSGNIKLIDFGASKQLNAQKGGATTGTAISYTPGYAPREQMEQSYDKFGPWTDIYALGATLYTLLTNNLPPKPSDIDDDISEDKHFALPLPSTISEEVQHLVIRTMVTDYKKRPQSIKDVRSYLVMESQSASLEILSVPNPKIVPPVPTQVSVPPVTNLDAQATKLSPSTLHENKKTIIVKSNRYSHAKEPPIVPSPKTPKAPAPRPIPPKSDSSIMTPLIVIFIIGFIVAVAGVYALLIYNDLKKNPTNESTPIETTIRHENIETETNVNQDDVVKTYDWSGSYTAVKDAGSTYGGTPIIFETSFTLKKVRDDYYVGTMEINGYQTMYDVAKIEGNVYNNKIRIFFKSSNDEGLNKWSDICTTNNVPLLTLEYSKGKIDADWFATLCEVEVVDQTTPVTKN